MTDNPLAFLDLHLLRYFAVVAEENNLHRAAKRLFMSQPPLSRHIKRLEEILGLTLFVRHTRGLSLTEDGAKVLEVIRPFLKLRDRTFLQLQALAKPLAKVVAVGFTTAFEQGIFTETEKRLRAVYGERLRVSRTSSPKLAYDVRKGKLDAAFVALPLDAPGMTVTPLHYAEPLVAALPTRWPEAMNKSLPLQTVNGKPLFWFQRQSNPAFFDHTKSIFAYMNYAPVFVEEPAEHDVLLARIAAGEGMGLLPASFAAITREGVAFVPVVKAELLQIRLGIVTSPAETALAEKLAQESAIGRTLPFPS